MNLMATRIPGNTDFNQALQCQALLERINVTDLGAARERLQELLEGMAIAALAPAQHLEVIENARATLHYVLGELARRYASRPLPPTGAESGALEQVVRLWQLMGSNYSFIAQRAADAGLEDRHALFAQRRLSYQALAMSEYLRARQEIPPDFWLELHRLFVAAERAGVVQIRVPDALNETWGAQSPLEAYVAMLLLDVSSPYGRSPRELHWTMRWAQRFAPYCSLRTGEAETPGQVYVLDTDADHGLRPDDAPARRPDLRTLQNARLASHIQGVVAQLKEGISPTSLGLGDDCVQPASARLLVSLYRPWGRAATGRKFPRRAAQGRVRLCTDPGGIAFFLTGRPFTQPDEAQARFNDFSRTMAILTLGERVERVGNDTAELEEQALQLGYVLEPWEVRDQSVTGFRLVRQEGTARLEHRQLVGVHAGRSERMRLAEISWIKYRRSGELACGLALLPGPPTVLPVRLADPQRGGNERYRLGFLVPGVAALKTEPTLILPAGWYVAGRRVEVRGEQPWQARLARLVSRGANFDRVVFEREDAA
ncbi:MAG: hypothetical protein REI09_08050 [Candidatus Dactylopiibacterium sp.]|nr:hypothetical protein [Candidatus Dactylopiibacterium sp.]